MSKKGTLGSLFVVLASTFVFGQTRVPDNAIDFTAKDLNGKEHQLFTYLKTNRYVMLENVASW